MVALVLGMLLCVGLALAVVALVAVPARRDGRDILTPKGEEVVTALKERQGAARRRTGEPDDETGSAADGPVAAGSVSDDSVADDSVAADTAARS